MRTLLTCPQGGRKRAVETKRGRAILSIARPFSFGKMSHGCLIAFFNQSSETVQFNRLNSPAKWQHIAMHPVTRGLQIVSPKLDTFPVVLALGPR